ncbi:AI-2E family transporter [Dyadobacter luticola]|uniref:AI-2E family transporter n=1 Tax=Dyadobacter luticola TaxID=1979387 RepID=A0A5R9L2C9_9BACT|nr:AI-2E family transporter [Dyadobacter luticola]TLV02558.1 AI-2E family transporter [Dyadobacter luticola]
MGFFSSKPKEVKAPISIGLDEKEYPFYIKAPMTLIGLYLFFYFLYLLQDIIVPFAFAGLISILLNPVYNRFVRWNFNKILAIVCTIFLALLVVAGIMFFLSSQIAQFGEMLPQLKTKAVSLIHDLQSWLSAKFNVSNEKQTSMVNDALNEAMNSGKTYVGKTLNTVFGVVSFFILIPLYIFLLLFYKPLILNFVFEVFDEHNSERVAEILQETKGAVQSYIVGLMIETTIIAVLNSTALLILGVKYAVLLGVIGAILNLIPYIGGLIAIILPVLISFITNDGFTTPLLIIGAYTLIQFADNNIIVPRIVSSKVSVNALISILIVLLGGTLWGVSGMFLSIPFAAVLKIIFDRIEELKPWGKLLGDTMPEHAPPKVVDPREAEDDTKTLL